MAVVTAMPMGVTMAGVTTTRVTASLVNQTAPFPSIGDAIHPAMGKGVVWFTKLE